jgi:MYXO-CTERM domain-containing protein
VIYTNGGSATGHGSSLEEDGRQRVRDFFDGGGSFTGSCAGAFITMLHYNVDDYEDNGPHEPYYHLWPGVGDTTYIGSEYHDIVFEQTDHPLVAMYPSLADGLVQDVYHNYGCRFDPDHYDNPVETEYLGVVDDPGTSALHGYYNIMAYKPDDETGRAVVTCSHPESSSSGERLDLTSAIIQYALDGLGTPWGSKGLLTKDQRTGMEQSYEMLGDRQYHLWELELPADVEWVEITIDELDADCDLYAMFGERPDRLEHDAAAETEGTDAEHLVIDAPQRGTWYVAVYGDHTVLNGAAYSINVTWERSEDAVDSGLDTGQDDPPDWGGPRGGLNGCGCTAGRASGGLPALLLAGLLARRRRRERPATIRTWAP